MNRFILYVVFLFLFCGGLYAQTNLIYNGSFEEYYNCPTGNDLNNSQLEKAKGWIKPTLGTSDYFNRCATSVVGAPNNFWGNQEPYDGDGYVGLVPICWYDSNSTCGFEYIQSKLIQKLESCHLYQFGMYVSLAEYSSHGIGRLGALFSSNSIGSTNDGVINGMPQIYNQEGPIVDSLNWILIKGTFVANGDESYVTIGYFFSYVTNDTLFVQNPMGFDSWAPYYYIDNVFLYDLGENLGMCPFSFPNVITPNGDGINDILDISSYKYPDISVLIINRWGGKIIELNSIHPLWDGKSNGKECSDGVYFYVLTYGKNIKQSGVIHLVR